MEKTSPVKTLVGELHGRDAIYLDRLTHMGQRLELEGEINGSLCGDASKSNVWVSYRLRFFSVRALDARDIDLCRWSVVSSFDEVGDSEWLRSLGLGVPYKHYVVSTYDTVYRVAAVNFDFEIVSQRS
jgi:hypothetical protein